MINDNFFGITSEGSGLLFGKTLANTGYSVGYPLLGQHHSIQGFSGQDYVVFFTHGLASRLQAEKSSSAQE